MLTDTEAKRVIALLTATWPHGHLNEYSWKAYQMALDDLEYPDVEAAIRLAMRTETFCPVPATIRNHLGANQQGLPPYLAWGQVMDQVQSVGYYGTPKFDDPAITRAVDIFGWHRICLTEYSEMAALEKHFADTYAAQVKQGQQMTPAAQALPESSPVQIGATTREDIPAEDSHDG